MPNQFLHFESETQSWLFATLRTYWNSTQIISTGNQLTGVRGGGQLAGNEFKKKTKKHIYSTDPTNSHHPFILQRVHITRETINAAWPKTVWVNQDDRAVSIYTVTVHWYSAACWLQIVSYSLSSMGAPINPTPAWHSLDFIFTG